MGSKSKIHVIDFTKENLKPGTSTWLSTCNEIRCAFEECGCFEAIYNGIPLELRDTIFATSEELFNLPTEIKTQNKSDKPYFGYSGGYRELPLFEALAIDHPMTVETTKNFANLMWPSGNDLFCKSARSYAKMVVELDKMVMRMLCESYGIEKFYESYVGSNNYCLRFMRYTKPQMNEDNLGLFPHTDTTMISILHQNHVNGLQIKGKDGDWIHYEVAPSSFVVMAGDVLMAWSNDRIPACRHQVIMSESETRYSIGLFSFIVGMVHIPKELVDDMHPLKYKPFDHFKYLHYYGTEEARKSGCAIKAYCSA